MDDVFSRCGRSFFFPFWTSAGHRSVERAPRTGRARGWCLLGCAIAVGLRLIFFFLRPELFGRIVGQLPRSSWLSVLCVSRSWYSLLVTRGVLPLAGEAGEGLLFAAVRTGNVGLLKTCIAHPYINKVRCQTGLFFFLNAPFARLRCGTGRSSGRASRTAPSACGCCCRVRR
jgi:hypothetical protein